MSVTNIWKVELEWEDNTAVQAMRCCVVWTVNLVLSFLEAKTKMDIQSLSMGKKILIFL